MKLIRALAVVSLLLAPALADQNPASYKRDKILFQYYMNNDGATIIDTSTHSFTAGAEGTGQAIVTGKHHRARSLNGNGGFNVPDQDGQPENAVANFTLVVSFKPTGGGAGTSCFICKNDAGGTTFILGMKAHKPYMNVDCCGDTAGEGEIQGSASTLVSSKTYNHLVYVRRGQPRPYKAIYMNGVVVSSRTSNIGGAGYDSSGSGGRWEIGTNSQGANNNIIGEIDELTFYREALEEAEIKWLYANWVGRRKSLFWPSQSQE